MGEIIQKQDNRGSWERQNIDDIIREGHGAYARSLAFDYLSRLIEGVDPKSQIVSRLCAYFEEPQNFYKVMRKDFPASRAAHTRRLKTFNDSLKPLEQERDRLKKEEAALHEKLVKADKYDAPTTEKRINELAAERTKLMRELEVKRLRKPKRYNYFYNTRGTTQQLPVAKPADVEYLKALFKREAAQNTKLSPHPFLANLEIIGDLFQWPALERDVLRVLWALTACDDFNKLINGGVLSGVLLKDEPFNHLMAAITGTDRKTISQMLAPGSELMLSGILAPTPSGVMAHIPRFTETLMKMLDQPDVTMERMMRNLVGEPAETRLSLHTNFNYVADHINHVKELVANAIKEGKPGNNIIVYGLQDSGKTEFTKALAKELELPLFMLGEAKAGSEPTPQERLAQILLAKRLTTHMKGVVLAVDEAEDLLKIREPGAEKADGITKVYLNRLLERGHMTVWIVNDIKKIHPAVRRRFKYAVPFGALTSRDRLHAWNDITKERGLEVKPAVLEDLAAKYTVPVGSIVTAVENAKLTTGDAAALERSLRATGNFVFDGIPAILSNDPGKVPYYPELQNFKETRYGMKPEAFREAIIKHVDRPVPVLAYGPSGAGKKSFFRDLAAATNREFLHYNFVELFSNPMLQDLVLQEAMNKPCIIAWDGMAAVNTIPATNAAVSHVRSMVRQLSELVPSVQVFCSNVKDKPPAWLKQEFPFVMEYEALAHAQIKTAWGKFFGSAMPSHMKPNPLTPGHFATIVYRNRGLVGNADQTRVALEEVSAIPAVAPQPLPSETPKHRHH